MIQYSECLGSKFSSNLAILNFTWSQKIFSRDAHRILFFSFIFFSISRLPSDRIYLYMWYIFSVSFAFSLSLSPPLYFVSAFARNLKHRIVIAIVIHISKMENCTVRQPGQTNKQTHEQNLFVCLFLLSLFLLIYLFYSFFPFSLWFICCASWSVLQYAFWKVEKRWWKNEVFYLQCSYENFFT